MFKKAYKHQTIKRIKRIWRGTFFGILIGIVSGLGGIVFNFMINFFTGFFTNDLIRYLSMGHSPDMGFLGFPLSRWLMLFIPGVGGLIAGFLVFRFAPEAEGHGTDDGHVEKQEDRLNFATNID